MLLTLRRDLYGVSACPQAEMILCYTFLNKKLNQFLICWVVREMKLESALFPPQSFHLAVCR